MTAEKFRQIEELGGVIDLSARAKFVLSGADRVRYLNGQVTNDVRKASRSAALHALVTNVKGRIESEVFIHAGSAGDLLFLDAPAEHRESLAARLEKYIIADDVVLTDVTDEWSLTHAFGPAVAAGNAERFDDLRNDTNRVLSCNRFGMPGCDIWLKTENAGISLPAGVEMDPGTLETWRICRGIPAVPNELNADAFPQEAGLESRAMDFSKGCYIGQEILSRIKMTGKMPRVLVSFTAADGTLNGRAMASLKLFARDEGGTVKPAGEVTSLCVHPVLDRPAGLAYVRQGLERAHSLLLASEDPPSITSEVQISGT